MRYIYYSTRRIQNCERLLITRMHDITNVSLFARFVQGLNEICPTDLLNKYIFFSCLRTLSHLYHLYCHMGMCIFTEINSSPLIISKAVSSDQENLKSHVVVLSRYLLLLLLL